MRHSFKNVKRKAFVSLIALIVSSYCLVLTGCGIKEVKKYSYDTPESTVESMWTAVENKDVDGMLDSVTNDYLKQFWKTDNRNKVTDIIENAFQKASLLPRPAEAYEIFSKIEQDGLVRIEYRLRESFEEENKPLRAMSAYLLKQIDGKWKIYGSDSNLTGSEWQYTNTNNRFEILGK